jgi:prepilin-type processing-associated H-X9-DG protein
LAAILFPVFAQARDKARQTMCLSNAKQMGNALMMYYQDYDEALPNRQMPLPTPFIFNGYSHPNMLWYMALQPYYKSVQVFNCPSSDVVWKGQYTGDPRFGINTHVAPNVGAVVTVASIAYPADTILIGESDWTHSTADYGFSNAYFLAIPFHPSRFIPQRHSGGANLIFVDGHAKWYRIDLDPAYKGVGSVKQTLPPVGVKWYPDGSK